MRLSATLLTCSNDSCSAQPTPFLIIYLSIFFIRAELKELGKKRPQSDDAADVATLGEVKRAKVEGGGGGGGSSSAATATSTEGTINNSVADVEKRPATGGGGGGGAEQSTAPPNESNVGTISVATASADHGDAGNCGGGGNATEGNREPELEPEEPTEAELKEQRESQARIRDIPLLSIHRTM